MTLYCVLNTTKSNQPWIELVTKYKPVADEICAINQSNGIFSVVVEKELNLLPQKIKHVKKRKVK